MKKLYILVITFLLGQSAWAQIRDFQTTRLNSTAGAGVASILSTEAAILNPATAAFFNGSSFSYQSYSTSLRHESDDRELNSEDFAGRNKSQGFFMADHSGPVKGGISYLIQDENDYKRKQLSIHTASPLGDKTSLGLTYRYLEDTKPTKHEINHQTSIGLIQILDEKTIFGLLIVDPTRSTPGQERALAGFQYSIADKLTFIGDTGFQYSRGITKKYLWRAALQIQLFDDFFFRAGKFYDNVTEFKGNGWGVGWIGPRLGVEFAQKFSEQMKKSYIYQDETLVDTSLSAIIKF